ncbi:hypothetical protein [Prescottella equi]
MSNPQSGKWVRETVTLECPGCDTSVDFPPGRLNETRTIEYRRCEEGHVVEAVPYFEVVDPKDGERWD